MIWREDGQVAGKRVWMIQDMRLSGDLRPLRIRQDHDLRVLQVADDLIQTLLIVQMVRQLADDVLSAAFVHPAADVIPARVRIQRAAPDHDAFFLRRARRDTQGDAPVRIRKADQTGMRRQCVCEHALPHLHRKEAFRRFSRIHRIHREFLTAGGEAVPERIGRLLPGSFDLMKIALLRQRGALSQRHDAQVVRIELDALHMVCAAHMQHPRLQDTRIGKLDIHDLRIEMELHAIPFQIRDERLDQRRARIRRLHPVLHRIQMHHLFAAGAQQRTQDRYAAALLDAV